MSDVLIIEHGLSMRKIYGLIFKGSNLYFAKNAEDIIKIYRIKKPRIAVILSQNPEDVDLANLIKMLNPQAKIMWISPDKNVVNSIKNSVEAIFTPPFELDEFIVKYEELKRSKDLPYPLISS